MTSVKLGMQKQVSLVLLGRSTCVWLSSMRHVEISEADPSFRVVHVVVFNRKFCY